METDVQKTISVRRNTVDNHIGNYCQAVLGFLFVPLYIKYPHIKSYSLIEIASNRMQIAHGAGFMDFE